MGPEVRRAAERFGAAAFLVAASLAGGEPISAHPHVFVDGGVDFVLGEGAELRALDITWLYDEFETLYMLSSHGLALDAEGGLDEEDRLQLVRKLNDWPDDFDGSAHLSVDGKNMPLDWPTDLDARLSGGRLEMTFTRTLGTPIALTGRDVEVAFYESTYFFAFSVTNPPRLLGSPSPCTAHVVPFDPDGQSEALQATLVGLGREETPSIANVGALFADRIVVACD